MVSHRKNRPKYQAYVNMYEKELKKSAKPKVKYICEDYTSYEDLRFLTKRVLKMKKIYLSTNLSLTKLVAIIDVFIIIYSLSE